MKSPEKSKSEVSRRACYHEAVFGAAVLMALLLPGGMAWADEEEAPKKIPLGQFVTVNSPIDDTVFARVSNAALKLQNQATQEGRTGVLVLQIESGSSQFHHVQALAKFLTSNQVSNLTTVAWIPGTVTGANVLVALACKQIVMHPDAELGDIGRGKGLEPDEQQFALSLAQKRHNPRLNSAMIRGMFDPAVELRLARIRVTVAGAEQVETRVVTLEELETLQKTNVTIEKVEETRVKEPGATGTFRGSSLRALDVLVAHTAENRSAVAEHFGLPRESLREQQSDRELRKVLLIKVDGVIDTLQENFLQRQIDRAVADGAQAIVFEIDSPGGLLVASLQLANAIVQLQDHKVQTIAYVPKGAYSGAAIISLGCDEIYLHPDAQIGDAGPIEVRPGQQFERAPEKILSPLRASLAELAQKKHRPVAICEAMADRSLKVFQVTHRDNGRVWYMSESEIDQSSGEWIKGPQLRESNGELLFTCNGVRANELKLAGPPVTDKTELKTRLGLPANTEIKEVQRTWVDDLVFTLNRPVITGMLLFLAIVFIYLELHFSVGILGIMSVLCFALFFWSKFLGGTAGWLEVTLFVLGLGCLGLEFFVIPGFGVFGVTGILLVLASLVMAGHTWAMDFSTNAEQLASLTGQVLLSIAGVGVTGVFAARYLPSVPMFESLILGPPGSDTENEPKLRPDALSGTSQPSGPVAAGDQGRAITMLRPSGKGRFNDRVIEVVSEGPFITPETNIEVVSVTGNRIVVREA